MIKSSRKLAIKMAKALKAVDGQKGINSVWAQEGLKISKAYIGELYELFSTERFEDDAAEIVFFKDISPRFHGKYIYFYTLKEVATGYAKETSSRYNYLEALDDHYSFYIEERKERYAVLLREEPELDELHFLRKKGKMALQHEHAQVMDHRLCTPASLLLSDMRAYMELRIDLRKEMRYLLKGRDR